MFKCEDTSDDSVIADNVNGMADESIEGDEDLGSSSEVGSVNATRHSSIETDLESPSISGSDSRSQSPVEPQVSSLNRLLMRYAIKYLSSVRKVSPNSGATNSRKDYIDDIYKLINFNTRGKLVKCYDNYQIYTPDGKFWTYDGINKKASANIKVKKTAYSFASSFFPESEESLWTVIRLAIQSEGAIFYCINCGNTYRNLSSIESHSVQCEFANLIEIESDPTERHSDTYGTKEADLEVESSKSFKERFSSWISILFKNIKEDGHLQNESDESLFEQVKQDLDQNLVHFFNAIDMTTYQDKVLKVSMHDDFHKIFYDSRKITNEQDESAAFRIFELATRKVVSLNLLISIRDDFYKSKETTCNYQGCLCGGEFEAENDEPSQIVAHILNQNFLIVCEACNIGFEDFELFELHLTPKCCNERPKNVSKD